MWIEVRYFASLADRTGCSKEELELVEPIDVASLWRQLVGRHPRLGEVSVRPLVACDREYASWDKPLAGIREVAFLPPVSGG